MDALMDKCINDERLNKWIKNCMGECTNECMNAWKDA